MTNGSYTFEVEKNITERQKCEEEKERKREKNFSRMSDIFAMSKFLDHFVTPFYIFD